MSLVNTILGRELKDTMFVYDMVREYLEANDIESWEEFCYGDDYENAPANFDVEVRAGASKVVLVPHNEQFVVKLPYYGMRDNDGYVYPYCGARNDELEELGYEGESNNYCDLEANLYTESVEVGCAQFFVPVAFFDEVSGVPVYVQAKVTSDYNAIRNTSAENTYKYASIENSNVFDPDFGAKLIDFYSVDEIRTFLRFVKIFHVNDIDNYRNGGYSIEAGRYVIWDFAGFCD